jgi:hypothetical protein
MWKVRADWHIPIDLSHVKDYAVQIFIAVLKPCYSESVFLVHNPDLIVYMSNF